MRHIQQKKVVQAVQITIMLTAMVIMFIGCKDPTADPIAVTKVTLSESSKDMAIGDEFDLTAAIQPADAANQKVTWLSSNPSAVEVDGTGLSVKIKAKALVTGATVKVTTEDGQKIAECTVNVLQSVGSVTIPESLNLTVDGSGELITAVISPEDAEIGNSLTWSVAPAGVVSLSATTGASITVTPAGEIGDTATITVTTGNGKEASCTVTISAPISAVVKSQPNAGANHTEDTDSLFTLTSGKWTGEQTLTGQSVSNAAGNGVARTTLLYLNKPMKTAYTFRAKISFPAADAANILFGEFIDPDTTITNTEGVTPVFESNFEKSQASGNPSASNPGYRGIAAIRVNAPPASGEFNVNAFALMSEYALLGASTLSTLPGYSDTPPTGDSVIHYGVTGFVSDKVHTLELSWHPTNGYTYRIFVDGVQVNFARSSPSQPDGMTPSDVIAYPLTQINAHFEARDVDIFPGIMFTNFSNTRSITISEVELIQ